MSTVCRSNISKIDMGSLLYRGLIKREEGTIYPTYSSDFISEAEYTCTINRTVNSMGGMSNSMT